MVRINWTVQAKSDLQDIAEYISKDSRKYAQLQVVRLIARTKILKSQIFAGKVVEEIDQKNIRELVEGSYRIIYKIVNPERIDVLAIHHSARDLYRRKM